MEMPQELGVVVAVRIPFRYSSHSRRSVTPRPRSSFSIVSQSGNGRAVARVTRREKLLVQRFVVSARSCPVQPARRGAVEIFLHGRARDPHAARHRVSLSPSPYLSRSTSFIRRIASSVLASPTPEKRGDGSRHYLPLSSDPGRSGCRKRRNEVPVCSEAAGLERNHAAFGRFHLPLSTVTVPVCSVLYTLATFRWRPRTGLPDSDAHCSQSRQKLRN